MEKQIALERAVALFLDSLAHLGCETISIAAGVGRVLTEDMSAHRDSPAANAAALDGYAIRSADLDGARPSRPVRLMVAEGDTLCPGQAIPVRRGELLPAGCDGVLPASDGQVEGDALLALRPTFPFDHFVRRGSDYREGDLLLPAGTRLSPPAVALLSHLDHARVHVLRRPRVALVGGSPDWFLLVKTALESLGIVVGSKAGADLLLACGAIEGEPLFPGIKAHPLGTVALAWRQGALCLHLSPDLEEAHAALQVVLRPALSALTGDHTLTMRTASAILGTPLSTASPVRRFLHGALSQGRVELPRDDHPLSPAHLARCNCLVDLPAGSGPLAAEAAVSVLLVE